MPPVRELTPEEAAALGLQAREISADEAESLGLRKPHSKGKTALLHTAQGGLSGFLDEVGGVVGAGLEKVGLASRGEVPEVTTREGAAIDPSQFPEGSAARRTAENPDLQPKGAYQFHRDEIREELKETAEDNPGTALTADFVGSLASPVGKIGKGAKGVAGAAKAAAAQGAVAGAGYSDADSVVGLALDTAVGAGVGGAFGATTTAAVQGGKKVVDKVKTKLANRAAKAEHVAEGIAGDFQPKTTDEILDAAHTAKTKEAKEKLTSRVLNEVAEGESGARTTPTKAKHLDKASDAVMAEVTTGPDAKKVRSAYLDRAKQGRQALSKVIRKVADRNEADYDRFEKAGRHIIDSEKYATGLQDAADAANKSGRTEDAALVDYLKKDFEEMWTRGGGEVDLPQIRQWTTQVQGKAASAIGGLNDHAQARLKARASAAVSELMADTLLRAAGDDKALKEAAARIAKNNKRLHGLLTVDAALALRQWKEQSEKSVARTATEALVGAGVLGGAGAVLGGEDNRGSSAAGLGLIGLGLGAGGRKLSQAIGKRVEGRLVGDAIEAGQRAAGKTRQELADEAAAAAGTTAARGAASVTRERENYADMSDAQLQREMLKAAKEKNLRYVNIAREIRRRQAEKK